jgi:hypothetical protein
MATVQGGWWGRLGFIGLVLFCMTSTAVIRAADAGRSLDEAYLDALQGTWVMEGTLGSKHVRYVADGQRVLQGGFMRLHMIDADSTPAYEADLFIGFDAKAHDYIAHWLDRFGAPGARVVARGERQGQRLVLIFPYAEGAFRDIGLLVPASGIPRGQGYLVNFCELHPEPQRATLKLA